MLADRLSRYGRSLCDDALSGTVVHEVKRRVLDCLGCALGTWNAPPYRIARQLAQVVTVAAWRNCVGNRSQDPSRPRRVRQRRARDRTAGSQPTDQAPSALH